MTQEQYLVSVIKAIEGIRRDEEELARLEYRSAKYPSDIACLIRATDEFYAGFETPHCHPPIEVKRAIILKFLGDDQTARRVLSDLRFNTLSNYYAFTHAGMYYGVEPDGYIHT